MVLGALSGAFALQPGTLEYARANVAPGRGAFLENDWATAFTSITSEALGAYAIPEDQIHGTVPASEYIQYIISYIRLGRRDSVQMFSR